MSQPLRYRRISTRMWVDERFAALSPPRPSARYLWIFLLTGPHTTAIPGLFSAGEAALAEALRWPLKAFRVCFEEIRAQRMAVADWAARVVWIPKAINHNPPQSGNVITAWAKAADEIPACALKREALHHLGEQITGDDIRKAFVKAFGEALATPSAKPSDQASRTQEQEVLPGSRKQDSPRKPPKGGIALGFEEFWSIYPKKQDKADAITAWNKLAPDEELRGVILAAVRAQVTWPQWARDGVIPHGSTWLNKRRWEDEAPPAGSGNGYRPGVDAAWGRQRENPYSDFNKSCDCPKSGTPHELCEGRGNAAEVAP